MNIRKYIPNTITCLNLVSGCIASVMAFEGNLLFALLWIVAAAVFDFFDGLAARALKAYSPMGKELDSLADVVSFGVAPGIILFTSLRIWASASSVGCLSEYIPYLAFVVPAFSGLRLAKFNIDERQTTSFIGLPVPAHALLWSSAAYSLQEWLLSGQTWVAVVMIAAFCATSYLLVSEVPMFSLKIKSLSWKGNELRYILIIASALLIISFGFIGISGAILLYILLSVIGGNK
ncbi:MAG: CDP-diacylglycerol--serine O-phosphatidyltransferase [Parabacteroides sp.]|nr:CDP-diacylglycerol--serine O-phosphatidyltransferase [Parabacteroides sp.]